MVRHDTTQPDAKAVRSLPFRPDVWRGRTNPLRDKYGSSDRGPTYRAGCRRQSSSTESTPPPSAAASRAANMTRAASSRACKILVLWMPQLHRRILAGGGIRRTCAAPFPPTIHAQSSIISWHVGKRPSVRVWSIDPVYFFPRRIGTRIYEKTENRNAISCAGGAQLRAIHGVLPGCHVHASREQVRVLLPFAAQRMRILGNFNQTMLHHETHDQSAEFVFKMRQGFFLNQTQRRKLGSPQYEYSSVV